VGQGLGGTQPADVRDTGHGTFLLSGEPVTDPEALDIMRIVSEPHCLYTRYLLALAPHNADAGEEIRYLARGKVSQFDSAAEDFWLFDDREVAFSLFDARGFWIGAALTDDPALTAHAVALRDRLWPTAIPFEAYAKR
jgi:hypothetical protein